MLWLFLEGFNISEVTNNAFSFILILIGIDIIVGILVAGKERQINSSINLDGLLRKLGLLVGLVFVSVVDVYFQMNGVIVQMGVGLIIVYEGLSIIENLGKLGVDFGKLRQFFDPDKIGKRDDINE